MERKLKDSGIPWIGEIPEHWKIARIKDIYSFQTGATPPSKTESFYDGDNLWANIGDINGKIIFETSKHLSDEGVSVCSMNISPKGSLLYSFKLSVGQVAFCGVDMYTNEAIATFIGEPTALSYLYYVAPLFIVFNANTNIYGAPILNQDLIKNAIIPVPPLAEQERIAAYLDEKCGEIDELIDVEQQMISDLESYRQAVITEAVTHGLNPDVPVKETTSFWLPKIPAHWELHYLRGISKGFRKGNGITKEDLIPDGNIACVRYGDLYTKYNHHISDIHCRTNVSKIQNPVYAAYGDIYFTCSGEDVDAIGKSAAYLSDEDCLIGGDLIIMKHSQNPKFLGYSLDSIISQKQKSYGKSKLKVVHTSVKDLKNVAVAIPPLSEQKKIAEYLDAKCSEIDELIKVKQEKIETLKQYRQSLIFEAVTGKITIA